MLAGQGGHFLIDIRPHIAKPFYHGQKGVKTRKCTNCAVSAVSAALGRSAIQAGWDVQGS
jgi:hypothetical protein